MDKYAKYFDLSLESPIITNKYDFNNVTRRPNNDRSSSPPLPSSPIKYNFNNVTRRPNNNRSSSPPLPSSPIKYNFNNVTRRPKNDRSSSPVNNNNTQLNSSLSKKVKRKTIEALSIDYQFIDSGHLQYIKPSKQKRRSILPKNVKQGNFCAFCNKKYVSTTSLAKHENNCLFNPDLMLNFSQFKSMLPVKGKCPKCKLECKKLRLHANHCFGGVDDFSLYTQQIKAEFDSRSRETSSTNTTLLCELPFFSHIGCFQSAFEDDKIKVKPFKSHLDTIREFRKKYPNKIIALALNINSLYSKTRNVDLNSLTSF